MKAVLLAIQPKYCELIASGKKTIEVRKTRPNLKTPFKCLIYCTSSDLHSCFMVGGGESKLIQCCNYKTAIPVGGEIGNGKVIGEFTCDRVEQYKSVRIKDYRGHLQTHIITEEQLKNACLSWDELLDYTNGNDLYGWHISDLKIYDKPKELSEFRNLRGQSIIKPFQSWGYVCTKE